MRSLTELEADTCYHVADDDAYRIETSNYAHASTQAILLLTVNSLLFQIAAMHAADKLPTSGPVSELVTLIGRAAASCNIGGGLHSTILNFDAGNHTLAFTTDEIILIISALQAVAPTGGGSDAFHLASRLTLQTGVSPEPQLIGQLQHAAHDEYRTFAYDPDDPL